MDCPYLPAKRISKTIWPRTLLWPMTFAWALILVSGILLAQPPLSREYIRLSGSIVAIEPPPGPRVVSANPNSGSATAQTFTFTFSDAQNVNNLTGVGMLFSTSASTLTNACYVIWDKTAGTIQLQWDGNNGNDSKLVSSGTVLQNSQCSIGSTTATVSGQNQVITLAITFKTPFAGTKNIYGSASSAGANSDWVSLGSWTVP